MAGNKSINSWDKEPVPMSLHTAAGKKAGTRLYTHSELDHNELFNLAETIRGDFLMTYDNAAGVRWMAEERKFDIMKIAMKNTHHANMSELLIGRDLSWARCKTTLF